MQLKKLWKYAISLFLISFFIINWNYVSWIFNYRAIFGVASDFFQKDNRTILSIPIAENQAAENQAEPEQFEYSDKEDSIEIPKIEVSAPITFVNTLLKTEIYKALNKGVVHYYTSVLPGEIGQTIIIGHSAPLGWPKIRYNWAFSKLSELEEGDEIIIYFNHQKISYSVISKIFLERGGEIPKNPLTNSKNMLVLISCWPPGKDIKRIAVEAALKQ